MAAATMQGAWPPNEPIKAMGRETTQKGNWLKKVVKHFSLKKDSTFE